MNRCWFVRSGQSTPLRSAESEVKCSLTGAHSFDSTSTAELLNFSPLRSAILSICWFLLCFFFIRCIIVCLCVCSFCFIVLLPILWCKLYIYRRMVGVNYIHQVSRYISHAIQLDQVPEHNTLSNFACISTGGASDSKTTLCN